MGKRWINVLWIVPIALVVLVLGIAVCQGVYATPWFRGFVALYPGIPKSAPAVESGFPLWLGIPGIRHSVGPARWWHFSINLLWVPSGA